MGGGGGGGVFFCSKKCDLCMSYVDGELVGQKKL